MDIQSFYGTGQVNLKETFSPNQLFRGKVVKILNENLAEVLVNGKVLKAKIEVPITLGNSYLFKTGNMKSGALLNLQVIRDLSSSRQPETQVIIDTLKLPQDKLSEHVVRFFIKEQRPMNKKQLMLVRSMLEDLSASERAKRLSTLSFMEKSRIPLKGSYVKMIESTRSDAGQMQKLGSFLQAVATGEPESSPLAKVISAWLGSLPGKTLDLNPENVFQGLRGLIRSEGFKQAVMDFLTRAFPAADVSKIMAMIEESETPGMLSVRMNSIGLHGFLVRAAEKAEADPAMKLAILLKANQGPWLKPMINALGLNSEIQDNSQAEGDEAVTLKQLLGLLSASPDGAVKTRSDMYLNMLNGQKLLSSENQNLFYYIFQLPLPLSEGFQEVRMIWEGQKQGKEEASDYNKITCHLQLERLGESVVEILVQQRYLTVSMVSEKEPPEQLVTGLVPVLKKAIERLDYSLHTFSHRQTDAISDHLQAFDLKERAGVDVKI